jgi:subtilisin
MVPGIAPKKGQYVVTALTGFQAASGRSRDSLKRLLESKKDAILASIRQDGEKLISMTEEELRLTKAELPGLVIEPNIMYRKSRHPFMEDFTMLAQPASAAGGARIRVCARGAGSPISGATVYVIVDRIRKNAFSSITDARGNCFISLRNANIDVDIIVLPKAGYWSRVLKSVQLHDVTEVVLDPLPLKTPEVYDWGHQFSGMEDHAGRGGEAITVGVIDTGICNTHDDVAPSGGSNCVFEANSEEWYDNDDGHGTHCAGIIAALLNNIGLKGYVPRAKMLSYRVFGPQAEGASTFDIINAIDKAVQDGCDIINMSLTQETAQTSLRVRTEQAYEKGVMCVAAVGNQAASRVGFPAAFPAVVGVSAFGRFGTYSADSIHSEAESTLRSSDESCFMAKFSNSGAQVDFCAPGVAIRSTVPGGYGAWDGTSMACPQVSALAALALATHPELRDARRDGDRVDRLLQLLRKSARPLGFGVENEGSGHLTVRCITNADE